MKKFLINYYAIFMGLLFFIYNVLLYNLKIGGLLYQIFMLALIILNIIMLVLFRKEIKWKSLVIIIFLLMCLFSKNILQCCLAFSTIITLCIVGFIESTFIKVISILITIFGVINFIPLYFVFLLTFKTSLNGKSEIDYIYDDMHYYCKNNYEIYAYSAGAMDSYHFSIGKHYTILDIGDIIYVYYSKGNEVTQQEYEQYLRKHSCSLVGE